MCVCVHYLYPLTRVGRLHLNERTYIHSTYIVLCSSDDANRSYAANFSTLSFQPKNQLSVAALLQIKHRQFP